MNTQDLRSHFPQFANTNLYLNILKYSMTATFSAEETIMDYGRNVTFIPLIVKGGLRILRKNENGREIFLYFLNTGETCTMSFASFMQREQSELRAVSEGDSTLLMIPAEKMESWILEFPTWKRFIMQSYRTRFNKLLKTIDSIAFESLDARLFNYLTEKAKLSQSYTIELTHQIIAKELNSSREVISRLLKKLENQQLIKLGRNKISLLELNNCINFTKI